MAGAVVPVFYVPELEGRELILDTVVLARIFRANITYWDDAQILATQTDEVKALLPHELIHIVVRSGSAGTTEVFKGALANFEEAFRQQIGTSSNAVWPGVVVTQAKSILGCAGYIANTPYTFGYVGPNDAELVGISIASLTRNGNAPVRCTPDTVNIAVFEAGLNFGNYGDDPAHLTVDLLSVKGLNAWPIASFTYLLLRKTTIREGATCENRKAVMAYWDWFYNSVPVAAMAKQYGFNSLPGAVKDVILARLRDDLMCEGEKVITELCCEFEIVLVFKLYS